MYIEILSGRNIKRKCFDVVGSIDEKYLSAIERRMPSPIIIGEVKEGKIIPFVGQDFLKTLSSFIDGKVKLNNKLHSELPLEKQEVFDELQVPIVVYQELSDELKKEIVSSLLDNVAKIELKPVAMGEEKNEVRSKRLEKLIAHPFFEIANLGEQTESTILAMSIIKRDGVTDILSKTLSAYATEEIEDITEELDYMSKAFNEDDKVFMKKIHLPIISYVASKVSSKISAQNFGENIRIFYDNAPDSYKTACMSGTSSKSNVKKRINELMRFF